MRVLVVHRRDKKLPNFVNHLIHNQANSVKDNFPEVHIDYFIVLGESPFAYFFNIPKFRKKIKNGHYDLIHAHYYLSGLFAAFSSRKPLVVSFMGSDLLSSRMTLWFIRLIVKWRIDWAIVKSLQMQRLLNLNKCTVIPNGINMLNFIQIKKEDARRHVGFSAHKKYGVFSESKVAVKNFQLVKDALAVLDNPDIEIFEMNKLPHEEIKYYLNAADFLVLTSHHEGSPNIIKEAMACNCPIISTDVGDVKDLITNTEKCYIVKYDKYDLAEKIKLITNDDDRANGREKMIDLAEPVIAKKIYTVYETVLASSKKK